MPTTHRLFAKNVDTRQGRCLICGPVKILRTGTKDKPQWMCAKYARLFRLRKWGMTADEFEVMLDKQNGICAACGGDMPNPQIDHSHYGKMQMRELLCIRCNVTLGNVKDDISVLVKLILYLRKHR